MTDAEREAELRCANSGRTRFEGRPEPVDEFLLRRLDEARVESAPVRLTYQCRRERDAAILVALAEGARAAEIERTRNARVKELLEYNNREVERRRAAIAALRTVLARIEGTVATMWWARIDDGPGSQYDGTLADFLRAAIAEEHG